MSWKWVGAFFGVFRVIIINIIMFLGAFFEGNKKGGVYYIRAGWDWWRYVIIVEGNRMNGLSKCRNI
jgi:hypothetical protein